MPNEKPKCLNCGKEMIEVFDEVAKEFTGYLWRCKCMPESAIVSVG